MSKTNEQRSFYMFQKTNQWDLFTALHWWLKTNFKHTLDDKFKAYCILDVSYSGLDPDHMVNGVFSEAQKLVYSAINESNYQEAFGIVQSNRRKTLAAMEAADQLFKRKNNYV